MQERPKRKKNHKIMPCRTCVSIRLFLMSLFGIVSLTLVSSGAADMLYGVSSLTIAILFVGAIGCAAIGKSLLEFANERHRNRS
jgi:hypothetical protein